MNKFAPEESYYSSTDDEPVERVANGTRFVTSLPNDALPVPSFNNWKFEDLFFHNNTFYRYNGINYSVLTKTYDNISHIYTTKVTDINGVIRVIYYTNFKREYDLTK